MWGILLSLLILFVIGRSVLFFLNQFEPKEKFSYVEVTTYSFSLGYAVLTIIDVALAQFGLLVQPVSLSVIVMIPILAFCFWIYQRRSGNLTALLNSVTERASHNRFHLHISLSHVFLLSVFVVGLFLRLESQLSVEWLGDMDPYYHLSFIDSILIQGTLPSRTHWGFYSYPPSFHVVLSTLISTTQIDRFLLMKTIPEFLGFLCVPAAYILIKRKYGEWAGIASAAFLAVGSFQIYRTNIAIPEPLALLGMLMFFHAVTTQVGVKKYLLGGLFASMVFLTNVVGIVYFLPSVFAVLVVLLLSRRWAESKGLLKATLLGVTFSGVFWLPTLYKLGLNGIFEGLGPSYQSGGAFSFTSNTYLSWIGAGAIILALAGGYVCLKDLKNHVVLLIPTALFVLLIEAANNGYFFLDSNLLFRGLLYLGAWVSLLAGVGFARIMPQNRDKATAMILAVIIVLTVFSFPVFSRDRYPVNWGYEVSDLAYRSYLNNYAEIFESGDYKIFSADIAVNYGAFSQVILDKELPQIREAASRNDSAGIQNLIREYNIRYMIFGNGTAEAQFFAQMDFVHTYYENWLTIVLVVER